MDEIPTRLTDALRSKDCVLFLGAGATREAKGPVGPELARLLADTFGKQDLPTDDLRRFADLLNSLPDIDRADIDTAVVRALVNLDPSPAHLVIPGFVWKAIFTTNYDRLVEKAYDSYHATSGAYPSQECDVALSLDRPASVVDRTHVTLFKLHGCISQVTDNTPLVLTTLDFSRTQRRRQKLLRFLKSLSQEHVVLFIGYSFTDGTILPLIEEIEQEAPYHSRRSQFAVIPSPSADTRSALESRQITCIDQSFRQFCESLENVFDSEARQRILTQRIPPLVAPGGNTIPLRPRLRASLEHQIELVSPQAYPQPDATPFLKGLPPTVGDLKNHNDIDRVQSEALRTKVMELLTSTDYLRPVVAVLGAGGAGKSTLALRVAYDIAAAGAALCVRLKADELWKPDELVELAEHAPTPTIFVVDGLEVPARYKAVRELRHALSRGRCRSVLLLSCQKAAWNSFERGYHLQPSAALVHLDDKLTTAEAQALIDALRKSRLIPTSSRKQTQAHLHQIIEECEGNLIVAMLSFVKSFHFREILLSEYQNLPPRAQDAYKYVALFHQHGLSLPDYLLNSVTVRDWTIFTNEVIKLESELIIVQDLNYSAGRLSFRTRHPVVAKVIVDATLPQQEDKVRMYQRALSALGTSSEDRDFLVSVLTSETVRTDLRDEKVVERFFELALDTFPEDRVLILHLGKYETKVGNLRRAREVLEWGLSLEPRDSYLVHQLGVCAEHDARREHDELIRDAKFSEAVRQYLLKQDLDPTSHYGFSAEARLHLFRAGQGATDDRRREYLSAAADALRRGYDSVREDDKSVLDECSSALMAGIGDHAEAVLSLTRLIEAGDARYASSYHLLATSYREMNENDKAISTLESGLVEFPGDPRLHVFLLDLFESQLWNPGVRMKCRELLDRSNPMLASGIREAFIKAVLAYYDDRFKRAIGDFEVIRSRLQGRASTKIRVMFADANGATIGKAGIMSTMAGGRIAIKNLETGYRIPVDNPPRWIELGKPPTVQYTIGFSLAGLRALVT